MKRFQRGEEKLACCGCYEGVKENFGEHIIRMDEDKEEQEEKWLRKEKREKKARKRKEGKSNEIIDIQKTGEGKQ